MKKICIMGLGISGKAVLDYFSDKECEILAFDNSDKIDMSFFEKYNDNPKIKIMLGSNPTGYENVQTVYVAPGIPLFEPCIEKFKSRGITVTGEIELAYEVAKKPKFIGITGTNGKTTTISMLGEIYKNYEKNSHVVGNIGISALEIAKDTPEGSTFVAELSSFQLESIINLKPHIAAIINITPDHLERHKTMQAYKAAKYNITKNQTADDFLVLNKDDSEIDIDLSKVRAKVVYFSQREKLSGGVYYDREKKAIISSLHGKEELIIKREDIHLLGDHNIENTLTAVAVALLDNIPTDIIRHFVSEFKSVKHRMQIIRTLNGVTYINDSKGTNVMSTVKALNAIDSNILLIAGGYDKKVEFDDLIRAFDGKVKKLLLFGATKYQIMDTAIKNGFKEIVMLENLSQAVKVARILADDGECVLLSPACASWDMYSSYEERGEEFIDLVSSL